MCTDPHDVYDTPPHASVDATQQARAIGFSRRRFLGMGLAAGALGGLAALDGVAIIPEAQAQTTLTPDQALAEVMAGNRRFYQQRATAHAKDVRILKQATAEKQEPIVAVLACADSRVPVEMVFDEPIGRVFVTRVAGNIATSEIIASLEYGVAVLGVKALIVLGHTNCGAVKAAIQNKEVPGQISALYPHLLPAIYLSEHPDDLSVSKQNAINQAVVLRRSSTVIAEQVQAGGLKVMPAIYDVATGRVTLLEVPEHMQAERATR